MIDKILNRYYPEKNILRDILIVHSSMVAKKAIDVVKAHPELNANIDLVYQGAMLHDIGIVFCDAVGIECFGTRPYICHGITGADMLRRDCRLFRLSSSEVEPLARICERHTGTGLTMKQIVSQNLPLPHLDFLPETIEEQIICYADKFFSKTHPQKEKALENVERSLSKFGDECLSTFRNWHEIFG